MFARRVILILLLCIGLGSCAARPESRRGGPGDLSGIGVKGDTITLASYRGTIVMLSFWSTWCSQCVYELPMLQRIHERFRERGFAVVGVAVNDTPGMVRTVLREKQITFPVIIDGDDSLANAFRIRGVPEALFLGRDGQPIEVVDPKGGARTKRISGLRDWAAPEAVALIEKILAEY